MAKILIVDDSKTSRKFLRNMLEDAGHEIVSEAVILNLKMHSRIWVHSLLRK